MAATGVFVDVVGLGYESATTSGLTSAKFEYAYQPGEKVTFSIGSLVLGTCVGKPITTLTDLMPTDMPTFHPHLINRARLLFSLAPGQGFEQPVTIDQNVSGSLLISHFLAGGFSFSRSSQYSGIIRPLLILCRLRLS